MKFSVLFSLISIINAHMKLILKSSYNPFNRIYFFGNSFKSKSSHFNSMTKNGEGTVLNDGTDIDIFDIDLPNNENSIELLKIRHSTAHVMAMAVQNLFSDAKVTIGPWIDNG